MDLPSEIRRSMPLLSIGVVMELTDLSARQIRYYEEQGFITPARTNGNQRKFSLNDVDILFEVKDLVEDKMNMASVKKIFELRAEQQKQEQQDAELRRLMREERLRAQRLGRTSPTRGDLSRFY